MRTGSRNKGVANWKEANAKVTIKNPGAEDIIVKMDSYNTQNKTCALVHFVKVNNETFSVEKSFNFI